MSLTPGQLVASTRKRHRVDQRSLARRAGTSQAQISRIERDLISPSAATLDRLLKCMGERLRLASEPLPHGNRTTAELRADYQRSTPAERVLEASELSNALGRIASAARR